MKTLSLLALFAATALAQPPPADQSSGGKPSPIAARAEVSSGGTAARRTPNVAFSGALVQATRVNPLQLINPIAPRRLGDGYNNLSYNPVTGQAQGIRLFTISF